MTQHEVDVAVIGSGFGGSVTALLLNRIGLRVVLLERGRHPRFAIGESSTPIADLVLADLARRFDLPRLLPLTKYGPWRRAYPQLVCGLKRGFSYFRHLPGRPFEPRDDHANELLVSASADDDQADTHWLRADVDHFLVHECQAAGIPALDGTEIVEARPGARWMIRGRREGEEVLVRAGFVVDASGEAGVVARALRIAVDPDGVRTNSRAIYSHFAGVREWHGLLEAAGGRVADHLFCCDDAALHHIIDGGWMWVLRFCNGVCSAGFALDGQRHPLDPSRTPEEEWRGLLSRYPLIAAQFVRARIVDPPGRLIRTGRLQRRARRPAGPTWAMLPATACLLDPLHSTGNAHTLCGIERLVGVLARHWGRAELGEALEEYGRTVLAEFDLMDRIVYGSYASFDRFEAMTAFSMCYFAAATVSEDRRRKGLHRPEDAFLLANDGAFQAAVNELYRALPGVSGPGGATPRAYAERVAERLRPYNIAGLCDASKRNMYGYTG